MRFRPCIDLHDGKVKQIVGSTLTDDRSVGPVTNFETDRPPSYFAELYRGDGLSGGHVIILGPGNQAAALEALAAWPGGLQVGGGITPDNARLYLDGGAAQVIVTSFVFSGGTIRRDRLDILEKSAGRTRLVLDLSCRKTDCGYGIATDRWQIMSDILLTEALLADLAAHCSEFLVHAVDVEGKREGIDEELVRLLAAWSPIPAVYAGGIRSLDDLEQVRIAGNGRIDATIGSALDIFGGELLYGDVVAWQRNQNKK